MDGKRNKKGIITGIIGVALNLVLGAAKLIVGLISGSVSIISDAANNLSDAGSSVMTVMSFALGGRAADKEHPYGHGRYEYITALLIGTVILVVAAELIKSSIEKIITPVKADYSPIVFIILAVSVAVKLAMFVYYYSRAKSLESITLRAAAFDSLSDSVVTMGLLATMIINIYVSYPLEGIAGLAISAFILIGGVRLVLGTVNRLLGRGADKETERKISDIVLSGDMVMGVHDLRYHDYGPFTKLASIHAEFDSNISLTEAHKVIDRLEDRALEEIGVELVIHCDPIDVTDVTLNRIRHSVDDIVRTYPNVSVHDLDIHYNEKKVELDISVPQDKKNEAQHIKELIEGAVNSVVCGFNVDVTIDIIYD